ncbi:ATP-binding protein [Methylocystis sp. MJC1]|jgi:signal transduction histidine kinase/CheY-like chemotaxis protein|uniref:ATP-binding protein n=1 Tax=Methylocystis sp. MJC1 TaxID=2654282 RepID=UPI0013EBF175|nr:ATP-binding protein [Methylocystis sp. MJC1]KAF2992523.1 Signal transduction histidine-protein kinase BarA [Methylocystis sp. MJC1]MBU6526496.1 response regulator [Methylocystis sp. MJC1]UZX12937.1 ATP-binding protein [Methylocystis sp. MJC1]
MSATELAVLVAILLLAAAIFFAVRREKRSEIEAELERLRDEISELRAAAAAREKAEAASLAKSRFLATVSHEIRTPLNGVMGLAQLLAMTRLNAEQATYVEAIGDSSRALAQIIEDILDFSKIEAGKFDLRHETFALAPLIEGVVELLAPRAFAKGLEIASLVGKDAPRVIEGDPSRLRQVLVNLVGNAINFAERGGVGVRVARDGDLLWFEVRDTGPGVPEAAREAIFEEFEQGDASATRRQGGTGLGLAISRRLMSLMGGALSLAQTSSDGSTFAFTLPISVGAQEAPHKPLAGLRVLIVGDSLFEAPFLAENLKSAGGVAEIAANSQAGLALVSQTRPMFDAIIVDCALGSESVAQLAAHAREAGIGRRFLLFSPLERRTFGEAALGDFDGWLVKPVRSASLVARLSRERADAPKPPAAEPVRALEGVRALIAEDNDINALILTRHLWMLGAEAMRARHGVEAVALAAAAIDGGAAGAYDVIIMDLFMPDLDGREATRQIREAEARARTPRTPILALTASAQEEDARAARAAGVDAFLTKPVDFAALAATIEELRLAPRDFERRWG